MMHSTINDSKDINKDNKIYAALGFGLFCVLVGIPIWWKTTEVYRVGLPYQDIYSFHKSSIKIKINIVILNHDLSGIKDNELLIANIKSGLNSNNVISAKNGHLLFNYNFVERNATNFEQTILNNSDEKNFALNKLYDVEFGDYLVLVLSHELFVDFSKSALVYGRYIVVPNFNENQIAKTVANVLKNNLLHQENIELTYQHAKNNFKSQSIKMKSRSLRSSPTYHITFTVMNPQPDMLSIEWDIDQAIEQYLRPMLNLLADYADIVIKSQYIFQTTLNVKTEKSGSETLLPWSSLPHAINAIEPYLNSFVSNGPSLNFVVYIPTRDQTPTHLVSYMGKRSALNFFMSPRWGGVLIYNVQTKINATLPQRVHLDMHSIFGVFAPQLKNLLGFNDMLTSPPANDLIFRNSEKILEKTELGAWLLEHCVENVAKSSATLVSLAKLLDKIRNIVINDDVGNRVEAAVDAMKRSVKFLSEGRIREAFLQSRNALEASEKAFYDPSILELLYFPEDQKYAIYIPLFLPIGIPIIQSLFTAIKYLKGEHKTKKE